MNGTVVTNRLQNSFKITCTDHRIIEILGLRPSNRLPVSYYFLVLDVNRNLRVYATNRTHTTWKWWTFNYYVYFIITVNTYLFKCVPFKLGFIILSLIGVLRIPEEFTCTKTKVNMFTHIVIRLPEWNKQ